jgi:hypothetical protein
MTRLRISRIEFTWEEAQPPGILTLYHDTLMELSKHHQGDSDAVLRGLALVPWINFADACLLEKPLLPEDPPLRASPLDMGYKHLLMNRRKDTVFSTSSSASLSHQQRY